MAKVVFSEEKNINEKGSIKVKKLQSPKEVYFELIFGTLNIIFSLFVIILSLTIQYFSEPIKSIIGEQFPLNFDWLIILLIPILILGVLLHLFSLEKLVRRLYKFYGFLIFITGIIMTILIMYLIFNYSLNWFGRNIFGNTEIGNSNYMFIPTLMYLFYSCFIVYYSLNLMRK